MQLAKIQNEGLQTVLGAYKATGVSVIENVVRVSPIEVVLEKRHWTTRGGSKEQLGKR
jgi:hypothetical protein